MGKIREKEVKYTGNIGFSMTEIFNLFPKKVQFLNLKAKSSSIRVRRQFGMKSESGSRWSKKNNVFWSLVEPRWWSYRTSALSFCYFTFDNVTHTRASQ